MVQGIEVALGLEREGPSIMVVLRVGAKALATLASEAKFRVGAVEAVCVCVCVCD